MNDYISVTHANVHFRVCQPSLVISDNGILAFEAIFNPDCVPKIDAFSETLVHIPERGFYLGMAYISVLLFGKFIEPHMLLCDIEFKFCGKVAFSDTEEKARAALHAAEAVKL